MELKEISLSDFRNIRQETVLFESGANALIGENGQGKTNLLEAIYFLACGKSFRNSRYRELICHQKEKAVLSAKIHGGGSDFELRVELDRKEGKSIYKNGCKIEKLSRFLGLFRVVLFCPEHLQLVKSAPKLRRSFLDGAICQLRPYYASLLNEFLKTEAQRSALLKNCSRTGRVPEELITVWDEKISTVAAKISMYRKEYLDRLCLLAPENYRQIAGGREKMVLSYQSDVFREGFSEEETAKAYRELLKENREADLKYGFTQKGPHRDDFSIQIDSYPARLYASQGQQRSAVLALKLAEGEISRAETGEEPLILLDDVLSELDESRRNFITAGFSSRQSILTGTDEDNFHFTEKKIFVKGGTFRDEKPVL